VSTPLPATAEEPRTGVLELPDFELELGGALRNARLAYRTHGTLSPARDNAVLFLHMYAGTPASLDRWIEAGRPLDPQRWFVVCPGQLGNGESSSPSDGERPFPPLTIGDDVEAQRRLLDHLGIETVELALGFSMGAQQAWEWGVRLPDRVRRLALFAGTARTTPYGALVVEAAAEALRAGGLAAHARFWAATGLSAELFRLGAWRDAGYASVERLVQELFVDDFASFDPENLLCQLGKWRLADVSRHAGGDLAAALGRVTARTLVVPFSHDAFFPVGDCAAEQLLVPDSELRIVESVWGHYAWGSGEAETRQVDDVLRELLGAEETGSRRLVR
jgi:homoserine O-acetyltransferase/O-succinyltransferase